jgi:WD40 repeat protein
LASGKSLRTFDAGSRLIPSVAISPDGSKLLAGTADDKSEALLWSIDSGKMLRSFRCSLDDVASSVGYVAFSPNCRQVLAASNHQSAFLFDVATGRALRTFDDEYEDDKAAAFSPDGRYVLTAAPRHWWSYQEAVLWEAATGKHIQAFRGPNDPVRSLTFNDDGKRLTVRYKEGWATEWDMNTGKPAGKAGLPPLTEDEWRNLQVPDDYKSPDGRWIVKANGYHNAVVLTDTRTLKKTAILEDTSYTPIRVAFSLKPPRIAVADEGLVHVFDPETGKKLATLVSAYGGRDWLVTTPGAYFDGSPGGRSLIRWRVGEAEYPLARFEKQFHRPDILARLLQQKPQR